MTDKYDRITFRPAPEIAGVIRDAAEAKDGGNVSRLINRCIKAALTKEGLLPGDRELVQPPPLDGPKGGNCASTDAANAGNRS